MMTGELFGYPVTLETFAIAVAVFYVALLVIPPVVIRHWYFAKMEKLAGAKELMKRQKKAQPKLARSRLPYRQVQRAQKDFSNAADLNAGIMRGDYGEAVKATQIRVYVLFGLWVLAVVAAFIGVFVLRGYVFPDAAPVRWS